MKHVRIGYNTSLDFSVCSLSARDLITIERIRHWHYIWLMLFCHRWHSGQHASTNTREHEHRYRCSGPTRTHARTHTYTHQHTHTHQRTHQLTHKKASKQTTLAHIGRKPTKHTTGPRVEVREHGDTIAHMNVCSLDVFAYECVCVCLKIPHQQQHIHTRTRGRRVGVYVWIGRATATTTTTK